MGRQRQALAVRGSLRSSFALDELQGDLFFGIIEGAFKRRPRVKRRCIALSLTFLLTAVGFTQTDAAQEFSYTISGAQEWIDTGTDLKAGDNVSLTAESKSGASANCNPAGSGSGEKLPVPDAPAGALIGRTSQR